MAENKSPRADGPKARKLPSPPWVLGVVAAMVFLFLVTRNINEAPPDETAATAGRDYRLAVHDAAVIEPEEIKDLPPLRGDSATVVTWTKYPDSFKPGESVTLDWGEVWVTAEGDLRAACKGFEANVLRTRVQQLLGLPLDDAPRFMVTLRVATDDLFRPCANPDLSKTRCGEDFPKDLDPAHYAWYARQTAVAYASPRGFPWTRLGYTYNWRAGADEVGLPELVIRKSAVAQVLARTATAEYCLPAN